MCAAAPGADDPVTVEFRPGEVPDTLARGWCPDRWSEELAQPLVLDRERRRIHGVRIDAGGWTTPELVAATALIEGVRFGAGPIDVPGGRIVFSGVGPTGRRDLWQLHGRTGRVRGLVEGEATVDGVSVGRDVRTVWYSSDESGSVDLWRWRIGSSRVEQVTSEPGRELLPVGAEDRVWYLHDDDARVQLRALVLNPRTEVVLDPSVRRDPPSLSVDGTRLCWTTDRDGDAEIAVLDRTTGVVFLPVPSPGTEGRCRWDATAPDVLWFESDRTGDVDVYRWSGTDNRLENLSRSPGDDRLIDVRRRR